MATQILPNIFAIHNLTEDECQYGEDGAFVWPEMLGLNYDSLADEEGIYVLDDGFKIFIHLNNSVKKDHLRAIFGVGELNEIELPLDEVASIF